MPAVNLHLPASGERGGPWWVQHRPDEASIGNRTAVTWTLTGELTSPRRLAVDPGGYLWLVGSTWGIDWWIGAEDRWHFPGQEASVRQSLVDAAPIVQTTVRVPSGDVHQRVLVVPGPQGSDAIVEIVNDSAAPVALAVAVRPLTLLGGGRVERVELASPRLIVDGAAVLHLPGRPSRALLVTGADPDPLATVVGGGAPDATDAVATCPEGMASAVVIVPLAHRATWQYRLAFGPGPAPARRSRRRRSPLPDPPAAGRSAPVEVAAAARGWRTQVERQVRLELPADRVTAALEAVRAQLLLAAGSKLDGAQWAEVAVAAATAGFGADGQGGGAAGIVEGALQAGRARRGRLAPATAGSGLWASGRLVRLGAPGPRAAAVAELAEGLAGRRPGAETGAAASSGAVEDGWAAVGLSAAAALLRGAGESRAATRADVWVEAALRRLTPDPPDGWLLASALGVGPPAPGPTAPLLLPAPTTTGNDRQVVDPARTLLWAAADLRAGLAGWYDRVAAVVGIASPTTAWPDLVETDRPGGCGIVGQSALVTARLWSVVRAALVDDTAGIAILPGWPAAWLGQGLEVHGLPTAHGSASFALRWHGERPALLWSVDGAGTGLVVTAPGLDRAWRGSGERGEALLADPRTAPGFS